MYIVTGPEGGIEGIFPTETDAVDYALEMTQDFTAPFSVWKDDAKIMTLKPQRKVRS